LSTPGRRRWGDDDSDDDELTVDAVRKARAAKAGGGGDDQSLSQMQMQTKDVSKKALSSTQRSLKQLEQTTQMAGATLEKMHDQVRLALSKRLSLCLLLHVRRRLIMALIYGLCTVLCRVVWWLQNAQMSRIDDDLDEMDVQLNKGNKEVDALGSGFAKGFAKDVAGATRPKMFGGKQRKEDAAAAARAIAEQERMEKEARDARRAEERGAKSSGASHMAKAAEGSKFGSKGVS
jgi:hypothetical protein